MWLAAAPVLCERGDCLAYKLHSCRRHLHADQTALARPIKPLRIMPGGSGHCEASGMLGERKAIFSLGFLLLMGKWVGKQGGRIC